MKNINTYAATISAKPVAPKKTVIREFSINLDHDPEVKIGKNGEYVTARGYTPDTNQLVVVNFFGEAAQAAKNLEYKDFIWVTGAYSDKETLVRAAAAKGFEQKADHGLSVNRITSMRVLWSAQQKAMAKSPAAPVAKTTGGIKHKSSPLKDD